MTADVQKRLTHHNNGKVTSTKPYIPYTIVYTGVYKTTREALQRERQIKKSGKLHKILKDRGKLDGPIV